MTHEPTVTIRRLGADDANLGVEAIRLLKAPAGYPVPSLAHLSNFLSRAENVLLVAAQDGVPVGYVVAYLLDRVDREQPMILFYEIEVTEAHRRRGIGSRLVEELKSMFRARDAMKMWVSTDRSNIAANRLYASTGALPHSGVEEVTYTYSRA